MPLYDHTFWFKDAYEQQYYIIKKHNQYRGMMGMAWNMFRYYFLGSLVPMAIYLLMKDYAHDTKNYYNAFFIESPSSPNYKRESNPIYRLDKLKGAMLANTDKDFLGRRGGEFYHVMSIVKNDPTRAAPIEGDYTDMQRNTPAGRSA